MKKKKQTNKKLRTFVKRIPKNTMKCYERNIPPICGAHERKISCLENCVKENCQDALWIVSVCLCAKNKVDKT